MYFLKFTKISTRYNNGTIIAGTALMLTQETYRGVCVTGTVHACVSAISLIHTTCDDKRDLSSLRHCMHEQQDLVFSNR